jgi:ABC-2 type transport system permease protein
VAVVAVCVVCTFVADGLPLAGSVAFGLSILFGAGAVFAAIAAVAAQVAAGSRVPPRRSVRRRSLSRSCVRAVGDVGDGRLSWFSPIGWAQAIRAFADERWWVLAVPIVARRRWRRRRRAGGPARPRRGPASGSGLARRGSARLLQPARRSPFGSTGRRSSAGPSGVALLGFFYGIVADQAESMFEDNPEMADYLAMLGTGSITDAFLATSMLMMGLVATGYAVSACPAPAHRGDRRRADLILTTPASRRAWMSSHLLLACGGTTVVMSVTGAAMGVGLASVTGDLWQIPRLLGAALAMVPALMVVAGLAGAGRAPGHRPR